MDLSFDIKNDKGDHLLVALSYYDSENVRIFTSDPLTLTLIFYDVTLIRRTGVNYVGYRMLNAVSDTLAKFLEENEDAVLCFYCDVVTDVHRNHENLLPQEYRSRLFLRMFDSYTKSHKITKYINHRVEIEDPENAENRQFAHFICRREHEEAVTALGQMLMQK